MQFPAAPSNKATVSLETLLDRPAAGSAPLLAPSDLTREIENAFSYHAPKGDQVQKYEKMRNAAKDLAYLIGQLCPHSKERALAITNLRNSIMWANASIACNSEPAG